MPPEMTEDQVVHQIGEKIEKIVTDQQAVSDRVKAAEVSVGAIKNDLQVEMEKVNVWVRKMEQTLTKRYGTSGKNDWLNEMAKFMTLVWYAGHKMASPKGIELSGGQKLDDLLQQKAAADFIIGTGAAPYAGYLIPDILRPGIIELADIYGNIYPRLTKVTVPASQNFKVPRDVARPTATWRGTQLQTITPEPTPMTFGTDTLVTMLLGSYIEISNELVNNPSINFAAVAVTRLLRGVLRKLETEIVQAEDGTAGPSDGILVMTGVNDQGNIASATFANVVTFLQACLADNEGAADTASNQLMVTPTSALALASQAVGASELTGMLTWGDPRRGVPATFLGYEFLTHPAFKMTTERIVLGDLGSIILAEDAAFSVDINPYTSTAFAENASWLRVFNHYDWTLGQVAQWHKSTIGA